MKKTFIFLSLLLAGCQAGGPITQADKDAIRKNLSDFTDATNKDSDDLGNGYAEDLISMPPHAAEVAGKSNVVAFHNSPDGPKTTAFTIDAPDVEGNGDLAYARGTFTFQGTINDSIKIDDKGKFLLIMKKQTDGSWKTIRETWNSDLPVPGQ